MDSVRSAKPGFTGARAQGRRGSGQEAGEDAGGVQGAMTATATNNDRRGGIAASAVLLDGADLNVLNPKVCYSLPKEEDEKGELQQFIEDQTLLEPRHIPSYIFMIIQAQYPAWNIEAKEPYKSYRDYIASTERRNVINVTKPLVLKELRRRNTGFKSKLRNANVADLMVELSATHNGLDDEKDLEYVKYKEREMRQVLQRYVDALSKQKEQQNAKASSSKSQPKAESKTTSTRNKDAAKRQKEYLSLRYEWDCNIAALIEEMNTMNEMDEVKALVEQKVEKLELQEKLMLNPDWPEKLKRIYEERIEELEEEIVKRKIQRNNKKQKTGEVKDIVVLMEEKWKRQEKLMLNPDWPEKLKRVYEERIEELEEEIVERDIQKNNKKQKTRKN